MKTINPLHNMTLGFQLYHDKAKKKPTHFPERILASLPYDMYKQYYGSLDDHLPGYAEPFLANKPKLHTIRVDTGNRWKEGNLIHFVIGNRTKHRYQFAPVIPVKSTQQIRIIDIAKFERAVIVDGRQLTEQEIELLAIYDGFDSSSDFWQWFGNQDITAKIIHWTNIKY